MQRASPAAPESRSVARRWFVCVTSGFGVLAMVSFARTVAGACVVLVLLGQHACIVVAAGAGIGGVVGAKVAGGTDVEPSAPVEVRFRPARELAVMKRSDRTDTTYTNVVSVLGRVRHVQGDTVWVVASELQFPNSRIAFSRSGSPVAVIVRGEGTSVRILSSEVGSALIGAGIGGLVSMALVYALILYALSGAST